MDTKLYTLIAFAVSVAALGAAVHFHLGEVTVALTGLVGALATALGRSLLPGGGQ